MRSLMNQLVLLYLSKIIQKKTRVGFKYIRLFSFVTRVVPLSFLGYSTLPVVCERNSSLLQCNRGKTIKKKVLLRRTDENNLKPAKLIGFVLM